MKPRSQFFRCIVASSMVLAPLGPLPIKAVGARRPPAAPGADHEVKGNTSLVLLFGATRAVATPTYAQPYKCQPVNYTQNANTANCFSMRTVLLVLAALAVVARPPDVGSPPRAQTKVQKHKHVRIVVVGRSGAGKSTVLNTEQIRTPALTPAALVSFSV
jgi:hypothetical protein